MSSSLLPHFFAKGVGPAQAGMLSETQQKQDMQLGVLHLRALNESLQVSGRKIILLIPTSQESFDH